MPLEEYTKRLVHDMVETLNARTRKRDANNPKRGKGK